MPRYQKPPIYTVGPMPDLSRPPPILGVIPPQRIGEPVIELPTGQQMQEETFFPPPVPPQYYRNLMGSPALATYRAMTIPTACLRFALYEYLAFLSENRSILVFIKGRNFTIRQGGSDMLNENIMAEKIKRFLSNVREIIIRQELLARNQSKHKPTCPGCGIFLAQDRQVMN